MRTFLRWLIIVSLISTGLMIAIINGAISDIYAKDATKLSIIIGVLLIIVSGLCGRASYKYGLIEEPDEEIKAIENIGWFCSELCLSLGMMGTVIGFIMMLSGFSDLDTADTTSMKKLLINLSYGMSTALYTTLTGLIAGMLLKLQFFNLSNSINDK